MMKFLLIALILSSPAVADVLEGKVVGVSDGDTVKILTVEKREEKIRLQGIDAPEKKQAFGAKAKQFLSDQVFGQQVKVEFSKRDRYGRILGKIVKAGKDVNLATLEAGMAWHYRFFAKDLPEGDRAPYLQAEERARVAKLGLWIDKDPTPPWDFRREGKKSHSKKPRKR